MKKIFFYIFSISVLLQGCSMDDNMLDPLQDDEANFPARSQELGKAVAKELREIVTRLNEMGVDYSDADSSPEFKEQFFEDIDKVVPSNFHRRGSSIEQLSPDEFIEGINSLTEVQIKFVERIIEECGKSMSYEDLSRRLIAINKDISTSVPKIEQERLFNVTAILYYGTKEIQNIEKQGQMIPTPYNVTPIRLRSGNESGDGGGFWGQCREITTYVWSLTAGAIYYTGEIVKSVTWKPAIGLFAVVLCFQGDTNENRTYCLRQYEGCINAGGPWTYPNSGGYGKTMCNACYEYCLSQKVWDCPRPV